MQCHADDVKNACKETVQLNLVNSLSILSFINNGFIFRFWSHFIIFYDLFISWYFKDKTQLPIVESAIGLTQKELYVDSAH